MSDPIEAMERAEERAADYRRIAEEHCSRGGFLFVLGDEQTPALHPSDRDTAETLMVVGNPHSA
jgi:succinylarginine dihydrolase